MLSNLIRDQIASVVTATQLDPLPARIWGECLAGRLRETEAQALVDVLEDRRAAFRERRAFPPSLPRTEPRAPAGRRSIFSTGKARPRSPDRLQSARRRQDVAQSRPLPPALACQFTEHERAAFEIVVRCQMERGSCALTVGEIAGRAGVSESTVRRAFRHAARSGLIEVRQRRQRSAPNLPNVVTIVSAEWLTWLATRPPSRRKTVGGGRVSGRPPTKNKFHTPSEKPPERHHHRAAKREGRPPDGATRTD